MAITSLQCERASPSRKRIAGAGKKLGRKALRQLDTLVRPEVLHRKRDVTILSIHNVSNASDAARHPSEQSRSRRPAVRPSYTLPCSEIAGSQKPHDQLSVPAWRIATLGVGIRV